MTKIRVTLLAIVALNAFAACDKDDAARDPSPEVSPSSNHVYFPEQASEQVVLGISDASTPIAIARKISSSALTVNLTIIGDKAFSIPQSVSFAAGESETTFTLSVGEIELVKSYSVSLKIDESQVNPYDTTHTAIVRHIVKEDFAPYAEGTYTSEFFEDTWPVTLEYSPATEQYRISDCWVSGYDVLFKWEGTEVTIQGTPNSTGAYIYLPTGYVYGDYGMISAYYSQGDINYYNKETKTFTFPITWVVAAGSFDPTLDTFTIEAEL